MNDEILKRINTGLATVLSAIFPGLGQFYNGKLLKGFGFNIIGAILLYTTFFFSTAYSNDLYFTYDPSYDSSIFVLLIYIAFWIFSILDAKVIQNYNK